MASKYEEIVLGGGCFWGVQELFSKVKGVVSTEAGYSGGDFPDPRYEDVKTGKTGHAEVVRIVFDTNVISLDKILDMFFLLHDPTTLYRQGPDRGSQYRSIILYKGERQLAAAHAAIKRAQSQGPKKVVTEVKPLKKFYRAEEFHQNYLKKHPYTPICHFWRKCDR